MKNDKQIFEEVYNDFFGREVERFNSVEEKKEENTKDEKYDYYSSIDNLRLNDSSKDILKKIILYMEKYYKKEEKNYITFNIEFSCNDQDTINQVLDIIKHYSNKYNYIDKDTFIDLPLYKISKEDIITNYYNDNGIIILRDLDSIKMNDTNFIKKFFYSFIEQLNKNKITIIVDKDTSLNDFLINDDRLKRDYFIFRLVGVSPDVNDVYNDMLLNISDMGFDDEFNLKLLDYITETFISSNLDYSTYVSNLTKYISFNKSLPDIESKKSVDEVFSELNELVGLKKVKSSLNDLVDLITLKNKTKDDLKINDVNLHMVFLGNPGTGKTTVARMVASILYDLGYIRQNKLIEVSSKDLVAEYVGQTAVKTMGVVEKALGGILFVDEAYSLASKNNDNSFNAECIATLIKAMEDYRDDLVVIFAGYTKEMQDFLDSNSGIVSRIGYTLEFEDYTNEELKQIFTGMVTKAGFILEEGALEEVERLINENRNLKNFGNARFIRNVFEKTVINHASNTKNNKSKKILKTITKKDIKYEV